MFDPDQRTKDQCPRGADGRRQQPAVRHKLTHFRDGPLYRPAV